MCLNFTANSFVFGCTNGGIAPRTFSLKLACRCYGTLFTQHSWNESLINIDSRDTLDNTYETINMEQNKAKTLQESDEQRQTMKRNT